MSKVIANTTARPIFGNYREGNGVGHVLLQPGLNEVKTKVFKALMEQPLIQQLLDDKTLSISKGDLKEAKAISKAVAAGEKTDTIPPAPEKPGNSTNAGASLSKTDTDAVQGARDKPIADANPAPTGKQKGKK